MIEHRAAGHDTIHIGSAGTYTIPRMINASVLVAADVHAVQLDQARALVRPAITHGPRLIPTETLAANDSNVDAGDAKVPRLRR